MNRGRVERAGATFAGLLGVVVALSLVTRHQIPDDSYIFFRYARNLRDGAGWVFNPLGGDPGNGATSPAWTLLLALASFVTTPERAGIVMFVVAVAAAGTFTVAALRAAGAATAGWIAGVVVCSCPLLVRMRGMESGIFVLAIAAAAYFGVAAPRGRRVEVAAGAALAVGVLARPEAVLLAALIGGWRWWRDRRPPLVMAAVAALPVLAWSVWATVEFGSPITSTMAAKVAQDRSGRFGPSFSFVRHVGQMLVQPWSLLLVVGGAAGVAIVARRWRRGEVSTLIGVVGTVVAFAALHYVAYGLVIRPRYYPWYYVPEYYALGVAAAVAAGTGLDVALARWVAARHRIARPGHARLLGPGGVVAVAAVYLAAGFPDLYTNDAYTAYRSTTAYLRAHSRPDATVGAAEIGVLGYDGDRTVVDYLGLLDPGIAAELGRGDLTSWFERRRPDFFVAHVPVWDIEAPVVSDERFTAEYAPVFESTANPWSHNVVYRRVRTGRAGFATIASQLQRRGVVLDDDARRDLDTVLWHYAASRPLQLAHAGQRRLDLAALLRDRRLDGEDADEVSEAAGRLRTLLGVGREGREDEQEDALVVAPAGTQP